ncbi:MAG: outer membrane protein assembly factor BamE [Alphaproteobacteria bacterium]|jgi:outer membrane protein assembly factor BamE (lipoprotein component of BamABCDE complex)|nr:outer membrane protein assembly factor BamE [Alphaproteobacteria bacterium]
MKRIFFAFTLFLLASCSSGSISVHGNAIDKDDMAYIEVGETSKDDMIMMFGHPTTKSAVDVEKWYYSSQSIKYHSFMRPEIVDRAIVEVTFDIDGVVQEVKSYDLSDGVTVDFSEAKTESIATEKTVLQQLIGNIGKFNRKFTR